MTKQRKSLVAAAKVAAAVPEGGDPSGWRQVTLNLPAPLARDLRRAATARAEERGGRPSVSALVVDILTRHKGEIEGEARKLSGA